MLAKTMVIRAFDEYGGKPYGRIEGNRALVVMSHAQALQLNEALLRRGCRSPLIHLSRAVHKPSGQGYTNYQAIVSEVLYA